MTTCIHRRWAVIFCLLLLIDRSAGGAPPPSSQPPAEQCIPQQAVFVVQIPAARNLSHSQHNDPGRPGDAEATRGSGAGSQSLIDFALAPRTMEAVRATPGFGRLLANPGFQRFRRAVDYFAANLATDWQTGLRKLVDGGVTWAVFPGRASLIVIDSADPQMLARLNEIVVEFAKADAIKRGKPEGARSSDYRGVTCWSLNENEHHAILGGRLLWSNRGEVLRAALDLRADSPVQSLDAQPDYQAARKAAGGHPAAWAYLNLAMVKQAPQIAAVLGQYTNPLATLLTADLTEALRQSKWLSVRLGAGQDRLLLAATADGMPGEQDAAGVFAMPRSSGQGALPNLDVPRRLLGISLYRDLSGFYASKERLFPERTSGLVFFENMMAIFFTGRDLTREVLAEVEPEVRIVAAQQQYNESPGKPRVEIPAFAAVFRIKHPQQFGDVAEEAWQKALGLANFTRGQRAQPGLILDKADYNDVRYSLAYFSAAAEEEKSQLDSRFNFRPTLVKVSDYLVLSSTDGLAKDLIDAMKKESDRPPRSLGATHSLVELDATALATLLSANRENIVRGNMLKRGLSEDEAKGRFNLMMSVVRQFRAARLTIDSPSGQTRAALELELNRP